MTIKELAIVDKYHMTIGIAQVTVEGTVHTGTIDISSSPQHCRELFDRWEKAVNDQLFGHIDELQEQIDQLGLHFAGRDSNIPLQDVQIYPSSGTITFRVRESAVALAKTA